jgi:filamentous hemagglutinin family protein
MTVCTVQQYNQALNSYAVRVGCFQAPPPATPTCSGSPVAFGGPTGDVALTATSSGGSGFYDPGANLPSPALPFNHLSATVTNATVNSVTYNSPTQVTLNITALTTGLKDVTIVNPDGQSVHATGCINAASAVVAPGAPTIGAVTAGRGSATVNFSPGSTGGATPTYTANCTATGNPAKSRSGAGSPITVTGLTGGVLYTCSVVASNSAGSSAASASVQVTPQKAFSIISILMLLLD